MAESIKCFVRSKELLSLLKAHGPLSTRALMQMMNPSIRRNRLREVVSRLVKKKFIVTRLEKVFGGRGTFYQLNQDKSVSDAIANLIGCDPCEVKQPYFRYRELLHTECAALWSRYFMQKFSGVKVIRDFEFSSNEAALRVMNIDRDDFDVRPDLLLIFPDSTNTHAINVAVEIEKTMKSKKRMRKKISKYALGARVDGIIYICDSEATENSIVHVFNGRIAQHSKNIRAYTDHFFMFCKQPLPTWEHDPVLQNVALDQVTLTRWISFLQANPKNLRRNTQLKVQASGPGLLVG